MATFAEFLRIAQLSKEDKVSGKRMREILSILRKNHVMKGVTPEQAVTVLEELGPTYVKIGQVASTRSDILPKEYCVAFESLHADVAPMSFETILACIDEAYGHPWSDVFLAIDPTPLGSASIAQVHKAVLLDGSVVAVKVRRPGIVEEMASDIALMKRLLATAEFLTHDHRILLLNFDSLVAELERTTANEVDFDVELNNLIRFQKVIADQPGISSPKPYPDISNDAVLVMEYIEGNPIDDVDDLKAEGDDLDELADRLVQSYISQVLDEGFFHADPHEGNIIVRGHEIVWIDLGMIGTLTSSQRMLVGRMFTAVATNDPYLLMEAVVSISTQVGSVDHGALLSVLTRMLDKYSSADLDDIDMGDLLGELVEILRGQNLVMEQSVTMLARGVVSIEGVINKIAPHSNVLQIISQHVIEQTLSPEHIGMKARELANSALRSTEALAQLPGQLSNTLSMLDRGELEVRGNIEVEKKALASIYAAAGRFSLSLISVGLFLGSSILCTTNMEPRFLEVPVLGILGYLGAFILGIYVIVVTFKNRHQITNDETPS